MDGGGENGTRQKGALDGEWEQQLAPLEDCVGFSLRHKNISGFECHLTPKNLNGIDDNQHIFQLSYDYLKRYTSSLLLPLCFEQLKNKFKI